MATVAILAGGGGFAGIAVAGEGVDELTECTVIDESGSYVLEGDLLVDGSSDTQCLRIEASDVDIDGQNNEIRTDPDGSEADGIKVADGTSNILIENVEFQELERGVVVRDTEHLTVRNNAFGDGGLAEAIDFISDITNATVEGNEVDSWDGGVISGDFGTVIDGLVIRDNTFEGMAGVFTSPEETVLIESDDVEDTVIEDNEFLDSEQTSITLEGTENVQVRNNQHIGVESSTVIDVSGGTDVKISNETFDSEGYDGGEGIRITEDGGFSSDPSTNVTVADSEVTNLRGTAIEVREAAEETDLAGNVLKDVEHGIVVEGSETSIEDTVIEETTDSSGDELQLPGLVFEQEAGPVAVSNTTLDGTQLDGTFADVSVNEFAEALENESAFEGLDEPIAAPEEGESVGVYFNLSSSSADGSWADLALNYTTAATDGLDESELKVLQYEYETDNWDVISDENDVDMAEQVVSANATGVGTVALYSVETVPPEPAFEVDPAPPATPGEGDEVTFDASASMSPNGDIEEYRWDFTDDGSVDETTSDPVATYTYDEAGEYEVTLTTEDEAGETNETSFTLAVTEVRQDGSEEFPYLIEDVDDLQAMNEDIEGHYELVADIDASETDDWNDGSGFEPVGDWFQSGGSDPDPAGAFTGALDGQGHTISNLLINRTDDDGVGVFAGIYDTTIQDVHFENVNVTGGEEVGSLVGVGLNASIRDISVTGGEEANVSSGDNRVGGVAGSLRDMTGEHELTGIDVDVTVTSDERRVGGIVGLLRGAELRDSTASGTVTYFEDPSSQFGGAVGNADDVLITNVSTTTEVNPTGAGDVGGLVGNAGGSDIVASNASGTVEGSSSVGGLVGGTSGNVTDSYATGDVSAASTRAGGLVGDMAAGGTVENSYATGDVSAGPDGDGHAGGLAGQVTGPTSLVTNSYATGDVSAEAEAPGVGGLVGNMPGGEIHQSKANGSVSADGLTAAERAYAGGLVGSVGGSGKLNQSYATGDRVLVSDGSRVGGLAGEAVDTDDNTDINVEESYAAVTVEAINVDSTGGFVGSLTGDIERSYWDVPESELEEGGAGTGDQDLTGLGELGDDPPADEMTGDDALDNMSGLDFENVWATTDEYPELDMSAADGEPALFEVTELGLSGTTVDGGETFDVAATIVNTGTETDEKDVELRMDGETETVEAGIELAEDESESVTFEDVSVDEVGEHDVSVWTEDDEASTTVTVEPGAVDTVEIDPDEPQSTESGQTVAFSATAFDSEGNVVEDEDSEFTWEAEGGSITSNGLFDETDAGTYGVTAEIDDVESEETMVEVTAEADTISAESVTVTAGESGEVVVEVLDESESPVPDEEVVVADADGLSDLDSSATTDTDGTATFSFTEDTAGTYEVTFELAGDDSITGTATATVLESAEFAVTDLDLSETTVEEGETFDVSATIENIGGEPGEKDVELRIDGQTEAITDDVELNADESESVTFDGISVAEAGEYDLSVWTEDDEANTTLTVEGADTDTLIAEDVTVDAGESGEVIVEVLDENGGPVPDEQVDVIDSDGLSGLDSSATTDTNGIAAFSFSEDTAGTYDVTFELAGDDSITGTATVTVDELTPPTFELSINKTNSPVDEGETFVVEATVENIGAESGNETVELRDEDGEVLANEEVVLDAGENTTVALEWETDEDDVGQYEFPIVAGNESIDLPVSVQEIDLGLKATPSQPELGEPIAFEAMNAEDPTWDFGDGETASGTFVFHEYTLESLGVPWGTITVTATDEDGTEDSIDVTIPQPMYDLDPQPMASTSIEREYGTMPLTGVEWEETFTARLLSLETAQGAEAIDVDEFVFELGDETVTKDPTTDGLAQEAEATFDLGELDNDRMLTVTAYGEDGSEWEMTEVVYVSATPEWLEDVLEEYDVEIDQQAGEIVATDEPVETSQEYEVSEFTFVDDEVETQSVDIDSEIQFIYDAALGTGDIDGDGSLDANLLGISLDADVEGEGDIVPVTLELEDVTLAGVVELEGIEGDAIEADDLEEADVDGDAYWGTTYDPRVEFEGTFDDDFNFEYGTVQPGVGIHMKATAHVNVIGIGSCGSLAEGSGDIEASFDVGEDVDLNFGGEATFDGEVALWCGPLEFSYGIGPFTGEVGEGTTLGADALTAESNAADVEFRTAKGASPLQGVASVGEGDQVGMESTALDADSLERLTDRPVEDTHPAIEMVGDDRVVVWSAQSESADPADGQDLHVRTHDAETDTWSDIESLTDDGRHDEAPELASNDNELLATWVSFDEDIDEGEIDEPADVFSHAEIAYAVNDGEDWSEPTVVDRPDDGQADPSVASMEDGWLLAWESAADGTPAVEYAFVDEDGELGSIETVSNAARPATDSIDDGASIAYVDLATDEVVTAHVDEDGLEEHHRHDAGGASSVVTADSRTVWANNTGDEPRLFEGDADGVTELTLDEGVSDVSELALATQDDTAFLTYRADVNGASSYELGYRLDRGDGWTHDREYAGMDDANHTAWYSDVTSAADGEGFHAAYAVQKLEEGAVNDVFVTNHEFRPAFELSANATTVNADDESTVEYELRNVGDVATTDEVTVSIKNEMGIVEERPHDSLAAGESAEDVVELPVDESGTFEMHVEYGGETNEGVETATVVAATPVLSVDAVESERTENDAIVEAVVRNDGDAAATDVPVVFDDGTEVLATEDVARIAPGENATVVATIDAESVNETVVDRVRLGADSEWIGSNERLAWFLQPDLDVGTITYVEDDGELTAEVAVANRGTGPANATVQIADADGTVLGEADERIGPATTANPTFTTVPVSLDNVEAGTPVTVTVESSKPDATPATTGASDVVGPVYDGDRPVFDVTIADIDAPGQSNDTLEVDVVAENLGEEVDTQSLVLFVDDDEVEATTVEVEPGFETTATFSSQIDEDDVSSLDLRVESETDHDAQSTVVGLPDHDADVESIAAENVTVEEGETGSVFVSVEDGDGDPVAGEQVSIAESDGISGLGSSATTGTNGVAVFLFTEDTAGTYEVTFELEDDNSVTDTATVAVEKDGLEESPVEGITQEQFEAILPDSAETSVGELRTQISEWVDDPRGDVDGTEIVLTEVRQLIDWWVDNTDRASAIQSIRFEY